MSVDSSQNISENNLQKQEQPETNPVNTEIKKEQQTGNSHDGSTEDPNWKAFREARKKDRAEREAAEQKAREKEAEVAALKAAMEAAFARQNPVVQPSYYPNEYEEREETEDERIEKKVQAAIAAREKQAEQQRIQREQQEYPQRLIKDFHDFNGTISQENLDYLDFHYPEVSKPLQRLHDGYDKWADIYRAVKKFVPNANTSRKEAAKADANFNKPKSISSIGVTQPGEAQTSARLTEQKRAENWARMQKTLKGVG